MKTAMMVVAPLDKAAGGVNTAAVESAVDAYATRVLENMSPPEAFIDASLGPYVTSLLRCADIHDKEQVENLAEFDSLLELLEDQCNMKRNVANDALKKIADAVCTGIVPHEASTGTGTGTNAVRELFTIGGLDSFQSLRTALPAIPAYPHGSGGSKYDRSKYGQMSIDPYTPNPAGGPSPLKPDNLIPVDLLGFLDDPSAYASRHGQDHQRLSPMKKKISTEDEAFPPLGSSKAPQPKKAGRGKKGSKTHSDKDLAAALFRPARPRQNSIETEDSPQVKPAVSGASGMSAAGNNQYFQQQWDSCVEILLSMNTELSEEAAAEAGLMANNDFNIAQYVVDAAMTAPPVCRHMLHEGCYRSDCQFSHDVEGHTCLFWIRGRCGKGASCKFLHGFSQKILDGIQVASPTTGASARSDPVPIATSKPSTEYASPYASFQPSTAPSSDAFGSFSLPSRGFDTQGFENSTLGSSWQPSSLADTSVSNSYSSSPSAAFSFANIASRGYDNKAKFALASDNNGSSSSPTIPTVRIPQDLWNPHENRDASVFHIADPIERYQRVAATVKRRDVIDLHFQSTKTFPVVLSAILPGKLAEMGEAWIVTGTGHHVSTKTHQKGGGALERSVIQWLVEEGYNFIKGRDRNSVGGAVLVKR